MVNCITNESKSSNFHCFVNILMLIMKSFSYRLKFIRWLTERIMCPQIYELRDAIALFLEHQGKNQLLQTFKKINFRGAWHIWQTQLKLWIQWIQNFKDQEQHHFYYTVLQELRAKIQLWVEWTGTKNISSIFDLVMHSKKRFIEMISGKYLKLHLVCSLRWILW